MAARGFDIKGLRSMAAAAAAALVMTIISLPLIAIRIDAGERNRERAVVAAELGQITRDLASRLAALANWDAALQHLDNHFDTNWAVSNLTTPFAGDLGNRLVIALDADDHVIFARDHAGPVAPARIAAARIATADLVAQLRAAERARARPDPRRPRTTTDWVVGSATLRIQGRPLLVVASLVGADFGAASQMHSRAPIILNGSDLQADILPGLQTRLLLRDATLATRTAPAPGQARLILADTAGRPQAVIAWMPERPGHTMLVSAALPTGITVAVLLAAIIFAYREGSAGARALQASEARAHHLAFHDGLTGLPNRRLFNDRFQQVLARAARHGGSIAVLLIDLDRFKAVNDTYGHPCGDELIQEVAGRLRDVCRAADICARLGGDEFALLAPDTNATEAASLAQRLVAALSVPARLTAATIQPAVSVGICIGGDHNHNAADLLRQADLALYKAKADRRGGYRFFELEMDQALQDRRLLEADLRIALATDGLHVAYQPQYESDRLVGVEALARWTHPQRGAIPPALFIPLAEESGLITELGAFVLRRAFAEGRHWPTLQVAVNVSAIQLRQRGFVQDLQRLANDAGIDPTRFELEITETVLLTDDQHLQDTLATIRRIGFRLALDDFGTGYCSLSYIGRFPINRIKIDRAFIAGLPSGNPTAPAIVRAIIALSSALGMEVLAEGVETPDQKRLLATLGCTLIQGRLVGHPTDAAAIAALLTPTRDRIALLASPTAG